MEGGLLNGGIDWNPCLIMFNYDKAYWAGQLAGYGGTAFPNPNLTADFSDDQCLVLSGQSRRASGSGTGYHGCPCLRLCG